MTDEEEFEEFLDKPIGESTLKRREFLSLCEIASAEIAWLEKGKRDREKIGKLLLTLFDSGHSKLHVDLDKIMKLWEEMK